MVHLVAIDLIRGTRRVLERRIQRRVRCAVAVFPGEVRLPVEGMA